MYRKENKKTNKKASCLKRHDAKIAKSLGFVSIFTSYKSAGGKNVGEYFGKNTRPQKKSRSHSDRKKKCSFSAGTVPEKISNQKCGWFFNQQIAEGQSKKRL